MKYDRKFFERDPIIVARSLIGSKFVRKSEEGDTEGIIIETEAYWGEDDLACHASHGRTPRTETLYGNPGHLYIYLNYGIFYLTNIVCNKIDKPAGVLIRAAEITKGQELAKKRLENNKFVKSNQFLATGPGKFSVAFGLNNKQNNYDIIKSSQIFIIKAESNKKFDIIETTRIGVDYAKHCKDYPWRFYMKDNQFVSKK